ncbi:Peroxisomal membrane protein 11D [Ananas comosus]|uniref:Peroxisomal membrane protein 11D n=1 Tax=Ananas comosus TaxID=4615 RepID=A0A199UXB1_ANACO|nr:Peroxisomal membrane protein 11D [Ananas comosus]
MTALDATRAELALLILYLNKAEARDKICRAIQYGSKFHSNGEPCHAQNVDKTTSLARKVFRLFKFVNDLHALISPVPQATPFPLILLGESKNALVALFKFVNDLHALIAGWVLLLVLAELHRLSKSMKKLEKQLKHADKYEDEEYRAKLKKSNERLLALIKLSMDLTVAIGLLQLAPKRVTPRVTGAFGFISSLISCYQ